MNRLARNLALLVMSITVTLSGCGSTRQKRRRGAGGARDLDKQTIFDRAEELYSDKKYVEARKYFSFVYDTFPNDPLGHKAALRVADSYLPSRIRPASPRPGCATATSPTATPTTRTATTPCSMVGRYLYAPSKIRPDRDLSNLREAFTPTSS